MKNEEFEKLYKQVFDSNGNITACGREKCKELMSTANMIKIGNYGDMNTGRLNIENIKELHKVMSI